MQLHLLSSSSSASLPSILELSDKITKMEEKISLLDTASNSLPFTVELSDKITKMEGKVAALCKIAVDEELRKYREKL